MFEITELRGIVEGLRGWLFGEVLVPHTLAQLAIVIAALCLSWLLSLRMTPAVGRVLGRFSPGQGARNERLVVGLVWPVLWLILLILALLVAVAAKLNSDTFEIATTLVGAWVVIRSVSSVIHDLFWARSFALLAWGMAALSILDLLSKFIAALDSFAVTLGGSRLSSRFSEPSGWIFPLSRCLAAPSAWGLSLAFKRSCRTLSAGSSSSWTSR